MAYPTEFYEMRFEWPHPEPNTVVVTGTFDQWSSSLSLSRTGSGFVGSVRVPWAEKIKYKFIVDGRWTCQAGQPTETDPGGFVNNVYITPPKPIAPPQSLDKVINAAVVEDIPPPAEEPAPVDTKAEEVPVTETKFAQPIPSTPPSGIRLPIIPVNDPEHNTILTTPPPAPIPDYVLPPSPRARSTSPPPTESRRPVPVPVPVPEPEPVKLHEVEPTLESAVAIAPEVPVEEKKQEAEAAIPVDCTAPEHISAKVEETLVKPEEEERIVVPETVPIPETPPARPELKEAEAPKSVPSALPTPPATPNPKAQRGSQSPSPTASPSSSRFGTTKSRKKRHSIFGKIKDIFSSDKDKEKVKSPK